MIEIRYSKILCPHCRTAIKPVYWSEDDDYRYTPNKDPLRALVDRYLNPALICPNCGGYIKVTGDGSCCLSSKGVK